MRKLWLVLFGMLLTVTFAATAIAQDAVDQGPVEDVGVGPALVAAPVVYGPPVCEWGYYAYYPYACAPYGYYGPAWFYGGVFLGAGPWYHRGWGHGWGYRGYGYRSGYGYRGAYAGRGYGGVGSRSAYAGGARAYGGGARGYAGARGGYSGGHAGGGHVGGGGFHGGGGGGFHGGGGHGGGHR
jgi:hypothetical protein